MWWDDGVATGQITGLVWNDLNSDGVKDTAEAGLANWTVYLDQNQNEQWDTGETTTTTDGNGNYNFTNLETGVYYVRTSTPNGWQQTYPGENASQYKLEVVFPDNSLTASQKAIFTTAANRWAQIITGDLPEVVIETYGLIDDLVIEATGPYIDGVGGILGQAGPTNIRSGSYFPASGIMEFDSADLANMEANGSLLNVILHEMGHVLGIGTIWSNKGLLTGAGGTDPRFTGTGATNEYKNIFSNSETSVPVENTGGGGTRDSHWREATFNNELMTGWLNSGTNPLSRITAASLADLGYEVNLAAADSYNKPTGTATQTNLIHFKDDILKTKPTMVNPLESHSGVGIAENTAPGTQKVIVNSGAVASVANLGYKQTGNGTGTPGDDIINGTANADLLSGLAGNDQINGLEGNDTINGDSGNDTLDGGVGSDTLNGGIGDDTYTLADADVINEAAIEGTDKVNASITHTLPINVENLELTGTVNINGTGNASKNNIKGNTGSNMLTGLEGNDTLDGGVGSDTLNGGIGNDTYTIADADVINEAAIEGTDKVNASITHALPINVENLELTGTGNIDGTGNASKNNIKGNTGSNMLDGGAGNDTLIGGNGYDQLIGGAGSDTLTGGSDTYNDFLFKVFNPTSEKVDTITDFNITKQDSIVISASGFGGGLVANNLLPSDQFVLGTAANDSNDRFIYNSGALFYDQDGSGTAYTQQQIATLSGAPTLSAGSIWIS